MATVMLVGIWGVVGWLLVKGLPGLALIALIGLYIWHVRVYPDKKCPAGCQGGHVFSGFLKNTSRPCGRCGGSGRVRRMFAPSSSGGNR